MIDERKHRLVLEIELPDFYAEEMTRAALAEWMSHTGQSYDEAVLDDLRTDLVALLVVESEGDKDSSVIASTALIRSARVIPASESHEPKFTGDHIPAQRERLAREVWQDLQYEAQETWDEDAEREIAREVNGDQ